MNEEGKKYDTNDDSTSSDVRPEEENSHTEEDDDGHGTSHSQDDGETIGTRSNHTEEDDEEKDADVRELLDKSLRACMAGGFIERVLSSSSSFASSSAWGKRTYRWVHDKLQEAAMDLVPSHEQTSFCRHVAEILCTQLTDKELESAIFVVVNRFNEGGPAGNLSLKKSKRKKKHAAAAAAAMVQQKQIELAKLNLRAAKKAVTFSAFESAASYCKHGINLLPNDGWDKHYRLCLDLYSLGADNRRISWQRIQNGTILRKGVET